MGRQLFLVAFRQVIGSLVLVTGKPALACGDLDWR